jgi:hypothetical protein
VKSVSMEGYLIRAFYLTYGVLHRIIGVSIL